MRLFLMFSAFTALACSGEPTPKPTPYQPAVPVTQPPIETFPLVDAAVSAPTLARTPWRCVAYVGVMRDLENISVDDRNRFVKEMEDRLVINTESWPLDPTSPPHGRELLCRSKSAEACAAHKTIPNLCRFEVVDGPNNGWKQARPLAPR